jgi:hypothetical protein
MLKPKTAAYLEDVTFRSEAIGDETKKLVVCSFQLQPFTSEQAETLGVMQELFSVSDGEPKRVIESITLHLDEPLQRLSFARAPDVAPSLVISDVKVSPHLKVRRDKEGPVLAALLKVSFYYPTGAELLFIANGVNEQHFLTFEPQQGDLLGAGLAPSSESSAPRRRPRGKDAAAGESTEPDQTVQ